MSCSTPDDDNTTERIVRDSEPVPEPPVQPVRDARVLAGLRSHERKRRMERLPERYELLEELGRGGMAVVHRARDHELDREVAVKFLRDDVLTDAEAERRFRREATSTARLNHPHIVTVHDAGDGYLVMELVEGGSLAEALDAQPPPDRGALVRIVEQVARAVGAAHQMGVVHRDLKPDNVMLDPDRQAKVNDFGLAHLVGDATAMTVTGAVLGTPAYMAPEQASGERDKIGPATDVYALGGILYECLTGVPPYMAESPLAVLQKIAETDPVPPRTLSRDAPRDLETIALVAMAREPSRRYPLATAFADDLARYREGRPIEGRRPSLLYRLRRHVVRRKALVAVGVIGVCAVIGVILSLLPALIQTRRVLALWSDVSIHLADAELYARAGKTDDARVRVDRGVARCRAFLAVHDLAAAHYFLGRLLARRGDEAEAIAALDAALERDAGLIEARFERGLLRRRAFEGRMMGWFLRYAGRPPGDPTIQGPTGATHERNDPVAGRLAEQVIEDLKYEVGRSPYYRAADGWLGRAEVARLRWEFDTSTALYAKVLAAESLDHRAHLALARQALLRVDRKAAIGHATDAIEVHRGLGSAYLLRAQARFWQASEGGRRDALALLDGVAADVERALALVTHPFDRALAHLARGHLRIKRGDSEAARQDLDRSLELAPDNPVALNSRGYLRVQADDADGARADFDAAIGLSPTYAQALYNRALLRAGAGDMAGAGTDAKAARRWARPRLKGQVQQFISAMGIK